VRRRISVFQSVMRLCRRRYFLARPAGQRRPRCSPMPLHSRGNMPQSHSRSPVLSKLVSWLPGVPGSCHCMPGVRRVRERSFHRQTHQCFRRVNVGSGMKPGPRGEPAPRYRCRGFLYGRGRLIGPGTAGHRSALTCELRTSSPDSSDQYRSEVVSEMVSGAIAVCRGEQAPALKIAHDVQPSSCGGRHILY